MSPDEELRARLAALIEEHRRLNETVDRLGRDGPAASLELQRLKKRKLLLRDQISALQNQITPDIIA